MKKQYRRDVLMCSVGEMKPLMCVEEKTHVERYNVCVVRACVLECHRVVDEQQLSMCLWVVMRVSLSG